MHSLRFSRRRFITTAGVTVTLPMLPSLLHTPKARAATCNPVKRFVGYMFPNGHHLAEHIPDRAGSGAGWALPPLLTPLEDLKSHLVFVSGLENQQRRRELGDHAIGCAAMLTARKPVHDQLTMSISVDQLIADAQKDCRGIHSLQLGTHNAGPSDHFGTACTRNISWRAPVVTNPDGTVSCPVGNGTPLTKEIDPHRAFTRLFQGTDLQQTAAEAQMRLALRKSVLDTVAPHGDWLRLRLNPEDRAKVDQLFTGIRSLEKELQAGGTTTGKAGACQRPAVPPEDSDIPYAQLLDLMHELMAIALQCDVTRVITFMMGDAQNDRDVGFVPGVGSGSDHALSHHSGDPELMKRFRALVLWKSLQFGNFVRKLSRLEDFDGQSVLDNTLVWRSSEVNDGNGHTHDNTPILLAGKLGGLVRTDRHVAYPTSSDYSQVKSFGDFFITLLGLYGVRVASFGDDGREAIQWQG